MCANCDHGVTMNNSFPTREATKKAQECGKYKRPTGKKKKKKEPKFAHCPMCCFWGLFIYSKFEAENIFLLFWVVKCIIIIGMDVIVIIVR